MRCFRQQGGVFKTAKLRNNQESGEKRKIHNYISKSLKSCTHKKLPDVTLVAEDY